MHSEPVTLDQILQALAWVGGIIGGSVLVLGVAMWRSVSVELKRRAAAKVYILQKGRPVRARVTGVVASRIKRGLLLRRRPATRLLLAAMVQPEGDPGAREPALQPYRVNIIKVFDEGEAPDVKIDDMVDLRLHPEHATVAVLDLDHEAAESP